jgi:hypothetical protein
MKATFTLRSLLMLIFMCATTTLFAHYGSVKGKVYAAGSQKPLEGVSVYIKEANASAVTDVFGSFFLKNVPGGTHTVTMTYIGFELKEEQVKIEDGVTSELMIYMNPASINLKDVTINSKKAENLSSISGVDLKLRPTNSAQDMLRLVPGLFIAQHAGGGKAEQMFLRGFDIDHGTDINVSVDGMPVNMVSHAHGQGYADLHFLIPELVEKLSFGKGPYQLNKGDFTTAGFAEFHTKDQLDNSFIQAETGMFGYYRTVAGIDLLNGKNTGKNSAYIAGEYLYNPGYFDASQDFNRINLAGKYTAHLSGDKLLKIGLSAFRSNWDASGQVPERAVASGMIGRFGAIDANEGGNTSRYNLNLEYSQSVGRNSIFKSNLYGSYYDFELYSNFTFFLNDPINGDQIRQKEKRVLTGYNAAYTTDYSLGNMRTKTELGAGFRYDNSMDIELSHTRNRSVTISQLALGDINETNAYGYGGQTLYLLPQLVLNAGVRFDYFLHSYKDKLMVETTTRQANTHAFSPKAGLYYNFSDKGRVYFNYGVGFHSNDTRVVVPQDGDKILPLAYSYDLGTVVKPFNKLLVSAAFWVLDLDEEFVYVGDEAVIENGGKTRRMGADLSLRYELLKWLYLDGDFNYTHARAVGEPEGSNYIPLAAPFTSIGGLTVKLPGGLSSSLRYRYMGDRPANEDNSVVAKGYSVFDATVNYERKCYAFGLQVQNLFNTEWNEAQFDTESRLMNEAGPVSELHFTPGTPFFFKLTAAYKF